MDIFWVDFCAYILGVNSTGHFLVVVTEGANAGSAGAKPLLGSANTVQCQG